MPYIDTQYLFKCETCRHCVGEYKCNTFCDSGECYSPNMYKIPTADVVEVVRCKDCKHWETIKTLYGEDDVCRAQGCMTVAKKPNDYCSLGERME